MRHAVCVLLLILLSTECLSQPIRTYVHLGGPKQLEERLIEESEGTYLRLYDLVNQDTVWVWIEHVTPTRAPDYRSAGHADLVVWCYPQKYPHPRHVLPKAKGLI